MAMAATDREAAIRRTTSCNLPCGSVDMARSYEDQERVDEQWEIINQRNVESAMLVELGGRYSEKIVKVDLHML
jgi:hypothetical protein